MQRNLRTLRQTLALVLAGLTLILITASAWQTTENEPADKQAYPEVAQQYERYSLVLFGKIAVGLNSYLEPTSANTPQWREIHRGFLSGFEPMLSSPEEIEGEQLLVSIVLAKALALSEILRQRCQQFDVQAQDTSSALATYVAVLCDKPHAAEPVVDGSKEWVDRLARSLATDDQQLFQEVEREARNTASRIGVYSLTGLFLFFLSAVLLLQIISKVHQGHLSFSYQKPTGLPVELLEIFALYLAGMALLPTVAEHLSIFHSSHGMLLFNTLVISSLSLLYLWPRYCNSGEAQRVFGLQRVTSKTAVADVLIAPYVYFASLSGLLCLLLLYSALLQLLGVDPASGTHPVLPLLQRSNDIQLQILVFLLAVCVAPIVEELLFRGALYGWLRSYFRAPSAIFISALIFAAVHPQGVVGIVPLTCIGILLAFLREWRQTLLAPIIAHACVNGVTLILARTLFNTH